jgi:hypothetical protein
MTRRHDPTPDCDGLPLVTTRILVDDQMVAAGGVVCPECEQDLCPCELFYGHDCEA